LSAQFTPASSSYWVVPFRIDNSKKSGFISLPPAADERCLPTLSAIRAATNFLPSSSELHGLTWVDFQPDHESTTMNASDLKANDIKKK
jgi:hypothetical protein